MEKEKDRFSFLVVLLPGGAESSAYLEPGSHLREDPGPAHPKSDSLDLGHESHPLLP